MKQKFNLILVTKGLKNYYVKFLTQIRLSTDWRAFKQMVSTVQIGGLLLFILLLYAYTNHNREIQATTSAIREIWTGSCRLSCVRQTPEKEEGQVIESRDCQTTQGNQRLSNAEQCECICDTCPCALIENVLRVCGPATGFYTHSIDFISRGYYSALTVLCEVNKTTGEADGRGRSRQKESKLSIKQCGSSDNILFINHIAVKAEEKAEKKEQDFGQWAESVNKKIELKLGRRVEAPVRVSNEQELKESPGALVRKKNEIEFRQSKEALTSKKIEAELGKRIEAPVSQNNEQEFGQKTEELVSQKKDLELDTRAKVPVNQTNEQECYKTTETSVSQRKEHEFDQKTESPAKQKIEPALAQIIELKQLKLLGSVDNINFLDQTDVRAEGVKKETEHGQSTSKKKEPGQETEKEKASGHKQEISFQNKSEATVLNELAKSGESQSPAKTDNGKPSDSTPFSTDSKCSVAASAQNNCSKCIAKGETCNEHCTKNSCKDNTKNIK